MKNEFKDLFSKLAEGSDNVMDRTVLVPWFTRLSEADDITSSEIKELLDEIVHCGLTNNFIVNVLDVVWRTLLKKEAETNENYGSI